jgi:integrase
MAAKMEKTATPGIYRRGGRYIVVWQHRGKQHKKSCRTMTEAREHKGRVQSGDRRPASRERFEDYAEQWLVSYRGRTSRGLSERTRRAYRRDLERHAIPYFRRYKLAEVEPPDVRAFIGHLEAKGLRPGTVRVILAPLKAMYATAVEDGAMRSNPTRDVRIGGRRDRGEEKAKSLTREQLARLLGELPEDWRLLFEFLAHTGLRVSEAAGLTWANVEFGERPRARLREQDCRGEVGALKSEHSKRAIPLSPGMARRLWALGADRPADERVFTSPEGARLNDGNARRRVLKPAGVRAGLLSPEETWSDPLKPESWVAFHTFRHTCASLLFESGKNVKQVAAWLGHADAGFTLRTYVHLMDEGLGNAAFLDALGLDSSHPAEVAVPPDAPVFGHGR